MQRMKSHVGKEKLKVKLPTGLEISTDWKRKDEEKVEGKERERLLKKQREIIEVRVECNRELGSGEVDVRRGMFQGDNLFPLLFCVWSH